MSEHSEEGSSQPNYVPESPRPRRRYVPPRASISYASTQLFRVGSSSSRSSPIPEAYIYYLNHKIEVMLTKENEAKTCAFTDRANRVPNMQSRKSINFFTRAIYDLESGSHIKCVAYVKVEKDGSHKLLGVKAPPKLTEPDEPGK